MQPTPEIAIIDANTLTCIGLRELIERMMPVAVVRTFNSFGQFVRATPDRSTLRAVQEGRCYVMDQTLYNLKPNARWGQAYEQLADILYPAA